jgi:hypothetical protein
MLGWMILFAFLSLVGGLPTIFGSTTMGMSMRSGGLVFACLFALSVFARLIRNRT